VPRPRTEALRIAERWKLGIEHVPPRGSAGERLGRGTGASLEFQDRRAYSIGDDVRHVDWRALARTDQWMVRLWREEVLARVELLVDASRSMAVDSNKAQLAVDLAAVLSIAAAEAGATPVLIRLGDEPRKLAQGELLRDGLEFDSRVPLADALRAATGLLRSGSIQIVVSDFLSPHDAAALVRPLGARAGVLALLQVLAPEEEAPPVGEAHRLIDCESGETLDVVLDATTTSRYVERLRRLCSALDVESRRARGRFVSVSSGHSLESLCRERLAREGLLEPR
jgi:uncharacterized protein (DUF58 family)